MNLVVTSVSLQVMDISSAHATSDEGQSSVLIQSSAGSRLGLPPLHRQQRLDVVHHRL
jgi:hypothetical protein